MTQEPLVLPIDTTEARLIHQVLCSTPHIYYGTDGGTYVLSAPDAEAVRALRYLTSVEANALVLEEHHVSLLRASVARLHPDVGALDEVDWFYSKRLTSLRPQLKALMTRLDHKGSGRRAIYSLRDHH